MSRQESQNLERIILDASMANDWETAVEEWDITGMRDDPSLSQCCICGQGGLRYLFTIQNNANGNIIYPIGSTCIKKFNRNELDGDVKVRIQAARLMDAAIELGKGKRVNIKSGFFTAALLQYMHQDGAFMIGQRNTGYGTGQWLTLDRILCKRKPTDEELREADAIIDRCVYPWLRSLYRRTRLRSARSNVSSSGETGPPIERK